MGEGVSDGRAMVREVRTVLMQVTPQVRGGVDRFHGCRSGEGCIKGGCFACASRYSQLILNI